MFRPFYSAIMRQRHK